MLTQALRAARAPEPQPAPAPQAPPSPFDQQVAQLLGVELDAWIRTPDQVRAAVVRVLAALTQQRSADVEEPPDAA